MAPTAALLEETLKPADSATRTLAAALASVTGAEAEAEADAEAEEELAAASLAAGLAVLTAAEPSFLMVKRPVKEMLGEFPNSKA